MSHLHSLSGQHLTYECMDCKSEFFKLLPHGWLHRRLHQWFPTHCSICQSYRVTFKGLTQS